MSASTLPQRSDCATCDRCWALEISPGEFFVCDTCEETRCQKHEDGDDMRREGETCGDCRERENESRGTAPMYEAK